MNLQQLTQVVEGKLVGEDLFFSGVSIDSRTIKKGELFLAVKGEQFDGHNFITQAKQQGAVAAVVSEAGDYPLPVVIVNDTLQALTQFGSYHRSHYQGKVVAITGSCGKTTVRALVEKILQQAGKILASQGSFNNHIGVPLTLCKLADQDFYVQEIGTNAPGEIAALTALVQPDVSVLTCVAPVHLAGFGSVLNIAKEKGAIFSALAEDGVAILNADDPFLVQSLPLVKGKRIITFGVKGKAEVRAENIQLNEQGQVSFILHLPTITLPISLQLLGEHNVYNALAAAAVGLALNLSPSQIAVGLVATTAEQKRMNRHLMKNGTVIINDSYNANPPSMLAALQLLKNWPGEKIFVVGDMAELGEQAVEYHHQLGNESKKLGINALFAFGPLSAHTARAFGEHGYHFSTHQALITALQQALSQAVQPSPAILIKGSNSMQMWKVAEALLKDE